MEHCARDWREECLQRLTHFSQSRTQIVKELAAMVRGLGFDYCSYVIRLPFPLTQPTVVWSSTYPAPWLEHYFAHGYLTIDPVLQQLFRDPTPVVWSTTTFTQEPAFWEEARAHRIRHGWAIATHGSTRTVGILSLARSEDALTESELDKVEARLVWLSHAAHGAISNVEMRTLHAPTERDLSPREREILRWTAAGKTAAEIGLIVGISERTVNFHIASTLTKFNVANKTQAVVTAVMLGMLY
jgi:LuxR family quorum-sensing system transcriptional regulator SolR